MQAAHLLYRLGASALRPRHIAQQVLPPLICKEVAMRLREQFYREGQVWPYEHIVPGDPQPPPGVGKYLKRQHKKEKAQLQRKQEIEAALAKMPAAIEEYRAQRRIQWEEVSDVDRLLLNRRQIREKYVKRRLAKIG